MKDLPHGEDVNYWKTGQSSPDVWIDKTKGQIESLGGIVEAEAFGNEPTTGRSAFMLQFSIQGERFKIVWPVLPTRSGDERAARVQAATLIYHDCKAKCITAAVLGARQAFFQNLVLPDGRVVSDLALPEMESALPKLLTHQPK